MTSGTISNQSTIRLRKQNRFILQIQCFPIHWSRKGLALKRLWRKKRFGKALRERMKLWKTPCKTNWDQSKFQSPNLIADSKTIRRQTTNATPVHAKRTNKIIESSILNSRLNCFKIKNHLMCAMPSDMEIEVVMMKIPSVRLLLFKACPCDSPIADLVCLKFP